MDDVKVTIGGNVFIGPDCGIYTADHPIDVEQRNKVLEYAYPISIGNNVWIDGGNPCKLIREITEEDKYRYKK